MRKNNSQETTSASAVLEKAAARLPGLDDVLEGRLSRGRAAIGSGGAGAGKTLLGLEFLHGDAFAGEPDPFAVKRCDGAPGIPARLPLRVSGLLDKRHHRGELRNRFARFFELCQLGLRIEGQQVVANRYAPFPAPKNQAARKVRTLPDAIRKGDRVSQLAAVDFRILHHLPERTTFGFGRPLSSRIALPISLSGRG